MSPAIFRAARRASINPASAYFPNPHTLRAS